MEDFKGLPKGLEVKTIASDSMRDFDAKVTSFLEANKCYQVSFPSHPNANGHSVGSMIYLAHILYVGSDLLKKDRDYNS